MGRPKGSKTKSHLDSNNIIQSSKEESDENDNPIKVHNLPCKPKPTLGTRGAKISKTSKVYHDLVGTPIDFFPQSKLPQNKVVLQRYLSLREKSPTEMLYMLVNTLYNELVTDIWKPARIFTMNEGQCKKKINYVIQKFTWLKKHPYKGSQACPKNISDFKAFLVQLCDLAPHNLKELLQVSGRLNTVWEKDWQFYLNMCQARQVGCIAGKDVKLAGIRKMQESVLRKPRR